ncbi:MAG TPA: hypothetical protein VGD67_20720 [Pseudonocardiaceae bacterium]
MAPAPSTQLFTTDVSVDDGSAPPEIVRFRRNRDGGDYYQALSAAAHVRLRLLGTLHTRTALADNSASPAARARLAAQQERTWRQLRWLLAEMRRMDQHGTQPGTQPGTQLDGCPHAVQEREGVPRPATGPAPAVPAAPVGAAVVPPPVEVPAPR